MGGVGDHPIDQAVFNRLCGRKEVVAVGVFSDFLQGLAGVLGQQAIEGVLEIQDLPGLNLDVHGLALGAAEGLVDHDSGVGQSQALAPGAAG